MAIDDPLGGSAWSRPETVRGFVESAPNADLLRFAERVRPAGGGVALDIGCGAGRNALALIERGWTVVGTDLSLPMLRAATLRARQTHSRLHALLAPMDRLPIRVGCCDLIVAHGIWNLARSDAEFRRAVSEGARAAAPGAGLFVFTFSRSTLPANLAPVPGQTFVFTQFSGEPQCFLTASELAAELRTAGFAEDAELPLRELNQRRDGALACSGAPVIHQGGFYRA